ncbi:MAG: hypothetical protein IKQ46_18885, partial [Bacteroidales bacterium]|nr:hypothetical protein [Bacteroidales bacterium]
KEDENNEPETPTTPTETNKNTEKIVVTAPEVIYPKQYQYVGLATTIDFKWEKPSVKKVSHIYDETTKSYNDTETELTDCSFKYELCYSIDGQNYETSEKLSEPKFTKNVTLEKGQTYYYKINTYISYGNTKDSLIEKYEYKFDDDFTIPFYSTYEQKHHIGVVKSGNDMVTISWDKDCSCRFILYEVIIGSDGKYTYKTTNDNKEYVYEVGKKNSETLVIFNYKSAIKYELSGKYKEKGTLHLYAAVDGNKFVYDGNFIVYQKNDFMNTDKQCAILPGYVKTPYLEPVFEFAPSGRLKRYNPCSYLGEMVTYENWKEFSNDLSNSEFLINFNRLVLNEVKEASYPFLKNGEYMCFDKDFADKGVEYESKNFTEYCYLIELMVKQSE